jgi:hypothetical protein
MWRGTLEVMNMTNKTKTTHDDAGLEQVDPATHRAKDARHFRRIVAAQQGIDDAEGELRAAVEAAREAGETWVVIGAALGTSKQNAFQRFGKGGQP